MGENWKDYFASEEHKSKVSFKSIFQLFFLPGEKGTFFWISFFHLAFPAPPAGSPCARESPSPAHPWLRSPSGGKPAKHTRECYLRQYESLFRAINRLIMAPPGIVSTSVDPSLRDVLFLSLSPQMYLRIITFRMRIACCMRWIF